MAEFVMPSLGADMTAGTLGRWLVTVGDRVSQGDIIAEVETDKGTIEVEVFTGGVIEALLVGEGEKVPVGTALAEIGEAGTALESASAPVSAPASASASRSRGIMTLGGSGDLDGPMATPAVRRRAHELDVPLQGLSGTGEHGRITREDVEQAAVAEVQAPSGDRVRISPYARRLARQRQIDFTDVQGTGPEGAIAARDLEGAPAKASAESPKKRMQRAIAAAMTRANDEIPHYYVEHAIDMGTALEWLREKNQSLSVNERLVSGVLFLRAVARALRKHPLLNATWQGREVIQGDGSHVGLAVSLRGGGLVAPALRDADQGSLSELMARMTDLVSRARAGAMRSSEMTSATITLTSLGERGVESVTPIIFPPQVAIVGFGAILTRPWVVDDQIVARPIVRVTLGADHRVSNGHQGARFLVALDRFLQEPDKL
ncbi:MAG: 2-oxo acid dehydrogenase subunit E2 [Myxococcales bacterium]|nr:2-oxo acid dehydrogenase subunit E2 [Myxococcales bacterium]MDH3485230.1 2-oxo acid dehydrogenase subunit E2 [Myxococcales bacterium]